MSKATEIIMSGIKGQDQNQPLTGRDIILGNNGAGKTTRAQAMGISLLGYVPGGGKFPTETAKLATDSQMTVGLKTETFQVRRRFTKKGGTVETAIEVSPSKQEKNATAKEQRVEAELGRFPAMLDFGEFISLTDTKRREFIYSLLDHEEDCTEGWEDKLAQQIRERITTDTPEEKEYLGEVIAEVASELVMYDDNTQNSLKMLHDFAKEQTSYWKKERELASSAAVKVSEQKNQLETTDRDKEKITALLHQAREERLKLERYCAQQEALEANKQALAGRLKLLQARQEILSQELMATEHIGQQIKAQQAFVQKVDFSQERATLSTQIQACENSKAKLLTQREQHKTCYLRQQAELSEKSKLFEKLQSMRGTCAIDPRIPCNQNFSGILQDLNQELSALQGKLEETKVAGLAVREQLDDIERELQGHQSSMEGIITEEINQHRKNSRALEEIASLEAQANHHRVKCHESQENHKAMKALKTALSEQEESADPNNLAEQLRGLDSKISGFTDSLKKIQSAQNAIASIQGSMKDEAVAATMLSLWKKVGEVTGPKGLQMELVTDALAPLTTTVQEKLDAMGIDKDFFFQTKDEAGKEVFQFGWAVNGSRRLFNALSTGEQLLVLIALMTTIIERVNPPLKMLVLDNTENLDEVNLFKVLKGLETAGANLDNIVFIGVLHLSEATATSLSGWKVWRLGEGAESLG